MDSLIQVAPLPLSARFCLRMRGNTLFGGEIPINKCVRMGERICARLGPDEWWIIAPESDRAMLPAEVDKSLGDRFHSLVDISDREVAFSVSGPRATDVINGGCTLDLHESAFPPGSASRTTLNKTEIVLLRPDADLSYRIECRRSFGNYTHALLQTLAREFVAAER